MPDITLNLPSSATPLASGSPVGEIRSIGAEASTEDAATAFAALLQNTIKELPENPQAALLATLMAEETALAEPETEPEALVADPAQLAGDLLASSLMLPLALRIAPPPDDRPLQVEGDDAAPELNGLGDATGRQRESGNAGESDLPAAAIAAQAVTAEEREGKNLPESSLIAETRTEPPGPQAAQMQHADFRTHLTAAQRPATEMTVATPISNPGWADDVGHQISWLAGQGTSNAELVLTPPHLGRIEISIQIGADLSTAQFVSASPQVREALEQAMPRLREMLAESGISLGQANVSSDQPSGERGQGSERHGRGRDASGETDGVILPPVRRGMGLVDLFA
ncbi:MAG: flagellar hook-length control protein FliK [Methyloversatilis sp.]|nr:flagellar hook-length control protein FliK [Methyloversatilis sp.]MBP6194407.1 flagellar hook-length control protein FliK [Methyloversatilis sp.]MBP9117128.1 flagellar hook-length control protein FliK [Methyloversatilis sp.]